MHLTIADAVAPYNLDRTIVVKTLNPNSYFRGLVNKAIRYIDYSSIVQYESRYGIPMANKGTIVGERFSSDFLNDIKNHPDNPLNLHPSFDPYSIEANCDCKIIEGVWDGLIGPMHDALFPYVPPPVDPPVEPPIEPPVDPPIEPHIDPPVPIKIYPHVPKIFIDWLKKGEGKIVLRKAYKDKLREIREWLEAYELFRKV